MGSHSEKSGDGESGADSRFSWAAGRSGGTIIDRMPDLFPSLASFVLAAIVVCGAQLIYATVGFGAGMFAVSFLALILPDLGGAVAALLLLTLVTEVWVLGHEWRHARGRLLIGLVPAMALGLWLGTGGLARGDVSVLKRALGAVVLLAGVWFFVQDRVLTRFRSSTGNSDLKPRAFWIATPTGFFSGVLAGLFGTGGPPVIVLLRGYGLDKRSFRATILWYFLIMSGIRVVIYSGAGLLSNETVYAAAWLLPSTIAGILLGMTVHHRLSERQFGYAVAGLLIVLGALLLVGLGR